MVMAVMKPLSLQVSIIILNITMENGITVVQHCILATRMQIQTSSKFIRVGQLPLLTTLAKLTGLTSRAGINPPVMVHLTN